MTLPRSHVLSIYYANRNSKSHLSFSPQQLNIFDVLFIICLIILKYTANLLRLHTRLSAYSDGDSFSLPLITLSAPLQVDGEDVRRYEKAMDERSSTRGSHSPFLAGAVTTPMLLILLANYRSPILPFGAVNTWNRFEFLDLVACRNLQEMRNLIVTARFGGHDLKGRRVKRGMEFDVVIEVHDASSDSRVIFRQIISTLQFLPSQKDSGVRKQLEQEEKVVFGSELQEMELALDAPSRWAAVCKDYNPIHMSSPAARFFGFPGKIAHGNYVVARLIESTRSVAATAAPEEILQKLWWKTDKASYLEVTFKRPIILPGNLATRYESTGAIDPDPIHFEVIWRTKACVVGRAGWI